MRSLRLTRSGDTRIRLGARRRGHADDRQPGPPACCAAPCGMPGSRACGATASACGAERPGGGETSLATTLTPRRRGDYAASRVTVRSLGPLGLAGRQAVTRCRGPSGCCRRSGSRRHLPEKLAMLRQLDGQHVRCCAARAASSTRSASTSWATTCARSTGARRARRARSWSDLAARAGPAHRDRARHRPDVRRPGGGGAPPGHILDAALLLAALASRAGDRVDLIAVDRRVGPG